MKSLIEEKMNQFWQDESSKVNGERRNEKKEQGLLVKEDPRTDP